MKRELAFARQSIERGQYKKAQEIIERSQLHLYSFPDRADCGIFKWVSGVLNMQLRKWNDAQADFEESVHLFKHTSHKDEQVNVMISLAKCISKTKGDESTLAILYKAYEISVYEKISLPIQMNLLFHLGLTHGKLGELYSSIYFLTELSKLNQATHSQFKTGQIQMSLGVCYMQLDNLQESKKAFEKAIYAFKLTNDIENLAGTYMNSGILYSYFQIYDKSYENLKESIALYQQINHDELRLQCMITLAQVYFQNGEFESAKTYCESVVIETNVHSSTLSKTYELLSDITYQHQDLKQALKYIDQALSHHTGNSPDIKRRLISKKAKIHYCMGDIKQSASLIYQ